MSTSAIRSHTFTAERVTGLTTRGLFVFVLFAAIFAMAAREISDPDFWWHLRTGQYIVETLTVPHSDLFSFTATGKEWVAHEWLSEALFYLLYSAGGSALLIVSFAALITCAFVLVYSLCEGKPYLAGFAVLFGALASGPTWGVRPQMLSFFLTSLYLCLLERYRVNGDRKYVAPLVPLMILWVNLHSGFALGLVVIAVYIVGTLVNRIGPNAHPRPSGMIFPLIIVFFLSVIAVMLNPNTLRMYSYPFETLTSPAMQKYIQEWFSPDFHLPEFQPFALLLIALLGSALVGRANVSPESILLLVLFGYASLRSARNIPIFLLASLPVLTLELAAVFRMHGWESEQTLGSSSIPRTQGYLNAALVLVTLAIVGIRVLSVAANQEAVEKAVFPAAAVTFIQTQKPAPNLYNSYDWGGYVIWRLYPEYKVYIDGRADVYGDKFIEDYLSIYRAEPGWNEQLVQQGVRLALVEADSPIAVALSQNAGWRRVFSDSRSALFEKN